LSGRASRRRFLSRTAALAGGLWISRAVPVAAAQSATGPARPVLLVHGFADRYTTWHRADNALVNRLAQAGYRWDASQLVTYQYPEVAGSPGWEDSVGDITTAGLTLARTIRSTAARSASGQVDLLAFSMGGLVSRAAINTLRGGSPGERPLVNAAVMVAAPNNGADILMWLAGLSRRGQAEVRELVRDLMRLDIDSVAARQMLPGSPFLQQLNQPADADDRVRYAVVAGAATVQVRIPFTNLVSAYEIGDGLISPASAGFLPGVAARAYQLTDTLGDDEDPWTAIRRSAVIHGKLMFNDTAALAAVAELAPWSSVARAELERRLESGQVGLAATA
jgi:pimeloyl-ACP methyl ester carboxylesterase